MRIREHDRTMAGGISYISWSGIASCAVGGFFYIIAWAKGREARQLEKALVIERLADLKKLGDLFPLLVAVTGRVWTDQPLECELSTVPAVIAQIAEEQHSLKHTHNGEWVKDVQTVRSSTRECPWGVEDSRGRTRLPVVEGRNASGDLGLVISGDVFQEDERPLAHRAVDHLLGWKVLGARRVERVLPVGSVVTAVGEVARLQGGPGEAWGGALRSGGQVVVLRAPKLGAPFVVSKNSLPQLVDGLDNASKACRYIAVGFGALGAALVVARATRGTLAYIRRRRLRRRVMDAASARAPDAEGAEPSDGGGPSAAGGSSGKADRVADLCVVCLESACTSVFTQCGHMCACTPCAEKLQRCPICRAKTPVIRVYRT